MTPSPPSSREAAALSLHAAAQIRGSLAALKRDVALSFRICSRDFGVLGRELLHALATRQDRENAAALALDHERSARRRAQARMLEMQGPVRVFCRVRPMLEHEDAAAVAVQAPSQQDVHVQVGTTRKSFSFDRVFHDDATQQQLYREVQPLVVAAVDGHHSCVFAYGQTGAGKSHTIQGSEHDRGLAFRAAETIFDLVREQQHIFDFNVTLQMVEIYNEELYDLIGAEEEASSNGMIMPFQTNPGPSGHAPAFVSRRPLVEIRHGDRGVYLRNVETVAVHCAEDVVNALERGEANRAVHATSSADKAHSSRSHCVVMIDIQRCSHADGQIDGGRFVLVDLAGSERLIGAEASSSQLLREAQHINKSLAAIGDVLAALLAKEKHVPYRNCKLTHLLQDSLGAVDAQTLMLAHVSPTGVDAAETINTLKSASRISHLQQVHAKRSERQEITKLQSTIASQAAQLQALQDKLAAELELRRKYEKRLEEYRQERRAKEDERNRSTPSKLPTTQPSTPMKVYGPMLPPNHQQPTVSSTASNANTMTPSRSRHVGTPEQPYSTRRWSLYAKKESSKGSASGFPARTHSNGTSAGGQENISENILRSRSPAVHSLPPVPEKPATNSLATPVRRARRLSLMMNSDRKAMRSPLRVAPSTDSKRKPATSAEVRSILKKRRLSVDHEAASRTPSQFSAASNSKQVSFDLSSRTSNRVGGVQLLPPNSTSVSSSSLPPRLPTTMLRTPMNATRVPAPASRVRAPLAPGLASPATRVRSPGRKPKWNGGWR